MTALTALTMRIALKSLVAAIAAAVLFGVAWGSAAASVERGLEAGLMMLVIAFVLLIAGTLWLTRSSRGRLFLATGLHSARPQWRLMVFFGALWALMYGVLAYVAQASVALAILAAGAIGAMFALGGMLWRLFLRELQTALIGGSREPATGAPRPDARRGRRSG